MVLRAIGRVALHEQNSGQIAIEVDPRNRPRVAWVGYPARLAVDVAVVNLKRQAVATVRTWLWFIEFLQRLFLDQPFTVVNSSIQVQLHQGAKIVKRSVDTSTRGKSRILTLGNF